MGFTRYGEYSSPLGPVFVASTESGICRVSIGLKRDIFIDELKKGFGPLVDDAPHFLRPVFRLFDKYFSGKEVTFDLPLDLRGTNFARAVAERAGRKHGARAAGGACGKNPVPIIIPCHRVILASGDIGGYSCGPRIKRALLALEGCPKTASGKFEIGE
jgi:O-6-methylguanine DNA methyltransferase